MANVLPPITKFKRIALDLLFPRWCIGCGREGSYICDSCCRSLSVIVPPVCPACGRPQSRETLCPECTDIQHEIDGIRSPFLFDGLIRQAIHELKYRNLRALAPSLAGLLHEYLLENPVGGEVLVPVPIHIKRLRERGYNQSALLAKELGKLSGLPVVDDCLVRTSYNLPQARSESVSERRDNVAGSFKCLDERLSGRRVIVIDDVSTSGATLNACAGALEAAGAASVWGLVLALEL
jgi:competence protein ComFC